MKIAPCILTAAIVLSACAKAPEQVEASYVSTRGYAGMTCDQLNAEAQMLSDRLADVTGQQRRAAQTDAAMTAVTLVLFWPAVFFIGHGDQSDELGRLKGEAVAIQRAAATAGCGSA